MQDKVKKNITGTTNSTINEIVQDLSRDFDYTRYTDMDVKNTLSKDSLDYIDFGILLSPAAEYFLETIAKRAKIVTRKFFGNSISLYTPLYISNFCQNSCIYCGFSNQNQIKRAKLTLEEIDNELQSIYQTGLREVLLLTGEDRDNSSVEYIGDAVKLATKYFTSIALEIYPLTTPEYSYLQKCGADFVSIYQETYNPTLYSKYHVSGPKKDYNFRFDAPERAINANMRGVTFGCLLGLDDFRKDAFATGLHAHLIQKKYPYIEISLSVPRLRSFINNSIEFPYQVTEKQLLQILLSYRLFMPSANINISTRERAGFRDNIISLAATKMSAEVKTSVGGHQAKKGDEQFFISDQRDVNTIHETIKKKGLQPVYTDFIRL